MLIQDEEIEMGLKTGGEIRRAIRQGITLLHLGPPTVMELWAIRAQARSDMQRSMEGK